jgi:hypothetical protein
VNDVTISKYYITSFVDDEATFVSYKFNLNLRKMKKTILSIAVLIAFGISMASCKKDYVCECSKTYTTGSGTYTKDYSKYTYKDTRKRAEDRCNENTKTGSDIYGDYSINCQIQ